MIMTMKRNEIKQEHSLNNNSIEHGYVKTGTET